MRKFLALLAGSLFVVSSALAAQPVEKDWTLLVYLNGDNNLDSYGAVNINQMEQVGSNDHVNIVVQWASLSAGTAKRVYVKKDSDTNNVTSPVIADIGKTDMGDWKSLVEFIRWGVQNYPAKHYMVDVWDHGAGWHSIQAMGTSGHTYHVNDISWDDNSGNYITTEQLGQAMAEAAKIMGHKVDIYGSDACLMAMAEVANEMSDSVSYFVGSQETEPGAGWPYADWLSRWAGTANANPTLIASSLVDTYVKSYQNGSNGSSEVTFSAYDLSKLPALDAAIASFGTKVRSLDAAGKQKLLATAQTVQSFTDADYGDLLDFMSLIQNASIGGLDSRDVADVQSAAKELIIANADTTQFARAKGLSIWLPTAHYLYDDNATRYKGLKFNAATDWGATLDFLLQGAQRRLASN